MSDDHLDSTARIDEPTWLALSAAAWAVRENARLIGPTAVGAAFLSAEGGVFVGCNVEHRYRSHCIHAEPNALTNMVAAGHSIAVAGLIAAERDEFTPCGACMDWIFQLGGPACLVTFEPSPGERREVRTAADLMPFYPR